MKPNIYTSDESRCVSVSVYCDVDQISNNPQTTEQKGTKRMKEKHK